MIPGTCPECGYRASLDAFLADSAARAALGAALKIDRSLADLIPPYFSLLSPVKKSIQMPKLARLLKELSDQIDKGVIERQRVERLAPLSLWFESLATVVNNGQAGKLTLPLEDHSYLFEIVWRKAPQVQSAIPGGYVAAHVNPAYPAYNSSKTAQAMMALEEMKHV